MSSLAESGRDFVADQDQRRRLQFGLRTDAVVIHCPGPVRNGANPLALEWERAQESFFSDAALKGIAKGEADLTVITYSTVGRPTLLERCADLLGLQLVVLGRHLTDWRWKYKITLVRDYLESRAPTNYVMCLDAFDTLVLASRDPRHSGGVTCA
jgi:hypothetical protein